MGRQWRHRLAARARRIAFSRVRVPLICFGFKRRGPALGYLAQVDYALLAALGRNEDDFTVSIETLDDIVFHDADSDAWRRSARASALAEAR